jgi:CheY-like chemotaxis protein
MAHQMATPTIHEGIAQAMSLGGLARPMQVDRPKRVLLVDDDRLVRMVLAALLRR